MAVFPLVFLGVDFALLDPPFPLAAFPAMAPITPPTTAPTGPATLPMTAPVAAPAACFEMGGMEIVSEEEGDAVPLVFVGHNVGLF